MKQRGITPRQLQILLDFPYVQTIYNWFAAKNMPTLDNLVVLAQVLGVTMDDILVHDAHCMDNTLQLKLAMMDGPDFPVAFGVIRDVDAPTYDEAVHAQIEEVSAKKKYHNFTELLETNDIWEVK